MLDSTRVGKEEREEGGLGRRKGKKTKARKREEREGRGGRGRGKPEMRHTPNSWRRDPAEHQLDTTHHGGTPRGRMLATRHEMQPAGSMMPLELSPLRSRKGPQPRIELNVNPQ